MRKLVLALVVLCMGRFSYADEVVYSGTGYVYNELLKSLVETDYAVKYDDQKQLFYLFKADLLRNGWIVLTMENLETLRGSLMKYLEWERMAESKGVEIEKPLPDSEIATRVIWKFGEDWYRSDDLEISFVFFSQSPKRHQLVVQTNSVSSSENEYVSFRLDPLYLEKKQAEALLEAISDESLQKALDKLRTNKANEDMFR